LQYEKKPLPNLPEGRNSKAERSNNINFFIIIIASELLPSGRLGGGPITNFLIF
jgi:hypothetical protein